MISPSLNCTLYFTGNHGVFVMVDDAGRLGNLSDLSAEKIWNRLGSPELVYESL